MTNIQVENLILGTFLFLNELGTQDEISNDVYKLDMDVFSSTFRQRVAERINKVTDGCYSFLSYEIENGVAGTRYELDFLDILSANTLTLKHSKKFHDDIKIKKRLGKICI